MRIDNHVLYLRKETEVLIQKLHNPVLTKKSENKITFGNKISFECFILIKKIKSDILTLERLVVYMLFDSNI